MVSVVRELLREGSEDGLRGVDRLPESRLSFGCAS